jgi:hypothetical protein
LAAAKSCIQNFTPALTSAAVSLDTCLDTQGEEAGHFLRQDGFNRRPYEIDQPEPDEEQVDLSEQIRGAKDVEHGGCLQDNIGYRGFGTVKSETGQVSAQAPSRISWSPSRSYN